MARLARPRVSLPVDGAGRRFGFDAFPPHVMIWSQRDVGENRVAPDHLRRVGIGTRAGSGGHSEVAGLGIDSPQASIPPHSHPGDIVSNGKYAPTFETGGGREHCQVGLAARTRKSGRYIGDFSLRALEPQYQHVLRKPSFFAT